MKYVYNLKIGLCTLYTNTIETNSLSLYLNQ